MIRSGMHLTATIVAAALLAAPAFTAQRSQEKLDELLAHIAPDAQIIVAVPNLKRLNDDVTELFGGMDRADLAVAARPIDLAKSMLGLGGGIDDRRGAAMALVPTTEGELDAIIVLPVVDADAFRETNFRKDEATGAYRTSHGTLVYIRALEGHHMLLTESQQLHEDYSPGPGARDVMMQRLGLDAEALTTRGEVLVLMDQAGVRFAGKATPFGGGAFPGAAGASEPSPAYERIVSQVSGLAYAIDVDPLGVMVHGVLTYQPDSELAGVLKDHEPVQSTWLESLPDKKYYFAAHAELEAAGAMEVLGVTASILGADIEHLLGVLEGAAQVSFIASPSPAGLMGGLLNDAAIVVHTDDPAAMQRALRQALDASITDANQKLAATTAQRNTDDDDATGTPPAIELTWNVNQSVGDDGFTADAYSIDVPATGNLMAGMARTAVFGRNQRGYLATTDGAVIMTFSTRDPVLLDAVEAVRSGGESLADDEVLASVARWMGGSAPIEVFIHLGQINRFMTLAAKSMGQMAGAADLPELDPLGPPIALRFGVGERSMTSMLALPAPVLSDILREWERHARPFTGGAKDEQ